MLNKYFIIFLLSVGFAGGLNAQAFSWSAAYNYSLNSSGNSLCTDLAGNVYVAGSYGQQQNNTGSFLAKYNSAGALKWNINLINWNLIVSMGPNNILIVAGVDSMGYYISKYDTSGTMIQKQNLINIKGGENGKIKDISVDSQNNYYLSGIFQDTLTLGSETLYDPTEGWEVYVAKFNSDDSCLWANSSTNSNVYSSIIKTDRDGNVFLGGNFLNTLSIGSSSVVAIGFNGFVCKFNSFGAKQWIYNIGSDSIAGEGVSAFDVDKSGNLYVTGSYYEPLVVGNNTLTVSGGKWEDIYLIKLSNSGTPIWSTKAGGNNTDLSRGLYVNMEGDVYLTGQYLKSMDLDNISLYSVANTSIGYFPPAWEAFVAKYSANGNVLWALQGDCDSIESAAACSKICSYKGNVFVTGSFLGKVDFNGNPQSSSNPRMFLAKIFDADVTAVNKIQTELSKIRIYPNPTSGNFCMEGFLKNAEVQINIFDITGKKVYTKRIAPLNEKINVTLTDLNSGVYFVKVLSDKINFSEKILVQN